MPKCHLCLKRLVVGPGIGVTGAIGASDRSVGVKGCVEGLSGDACRVLLRGREGRDSKKDRLSASSVGRRSEVSRTLISLLRAGSTALGAASSFSSFGVGFFRKVG